MRRDSDHVQQYTGPLVPTVIVSVLVYQTGCRSVQRDGMLHYRTAWRFDGLVGLVANFSVEPMFENKIASNKWAIRRLCFVIKL